MTSSSEKKGVKFFFILVAIFFATYLFTSGEDPLLSTLNLDFENSALTDGVEQIQSSLGEFSSLEEKITQTLFDAGDLDQDGLDNRIELLLGANISEVDSDKDGVDDYSEFLQMTDLIDPENKQELTPQFIEQQVRELSTKIEGVEKWAELYYIERAKSENLQTENKAELSIKLGYQYNQTEFYFTNLLTLAYEQENNDLALLAADLFVQTYPENPETYFYRGYAYQSQNEFGLAQQDYESALSKGSKNPALYNNLGVIAQERGELPLAKSYYQQAIELAPENQLYQKNLNLLGE